MSVEPLILFPPFRLDRQNEQLWRETTLVPVRPKPFAVLAYLASNPGRLVTAEELRKAIWPDTYVSEGLLRSYIRQIRQLLDDEAETPRFIETVARRGYRFIAPLATAPPPVLSRQFLVVSTEQEKCSVPKLIPDTCQLTTCLVGRESELSHLHSRLAIAMTGTRQVVFVSGEPGIGKTTLVDAFLLGIGDWGLGGREEKSGEANDHGLKSVVVAPRSLTPDPVLSTPQPLLPTPQIVRGHCIEHYGSGEAYLPVLEALGQLCRQSDGEQVVTLLARYAPTWLVQMPALVSDTEFEILQRKVQGATRERMLREMAEAVEALTAERPLVFVIEDMHWSDHATLDLLSVLARRRGPARLLLLATYRPADVVVSGHPLRVLKQDLHVHGQCEELPLGFLTSGEVEQYLAARFPQHQFPAEIGQLIHQSTEGNPLFMVNVVDEWVQQGMLAETDGRWRLATKLQDLAAGVPENLRQMIEKQLVRLTPEEQRVLETASVVGSEFTTATVAAALDEPLERVERWCEGLAKRDQFVRARGLETNAGGTLTSRFGFLHALYQNVLYAGLPATQRVRLHRGIGQYLEQSYGARAKEIATELANHFAQGQDAEQTVCYLQQAADNAVRRSAPQEAIEHVTKALALLQTLPANPTRAQQELGLLLTLGTPLLMTKGYAAVEVEQVYARARELCQQVGETPLLFPALYGLFLFHLTRARYRIAHEFAKQLLHLAEAAHDTLLLLGAHWAQGMSLLYLGELKAAEVQMQTGISRYDRTSHRTSFQLYGQDVGVSTAQGSWSLWLLGYPDQALQRANDALSLAQELAHPFSLAFALHFVALMHQFRRESHAAQQQAEEAIAFANEQSFPFWLAMATIMRGAELVEQGAAQEGMELMHQGLATHRALGADIGSTYWVGLLAEKYGQKGQPNEGLVMMAEAFTLVEKNDERWWEAELWRLKGELTLQKGVGGWRLGIGIQPKQKSTFKSQKPKISNPQPFPLNPETVMGEAERCFRKAIAIAQQQQAKSLELRAGMSLVRLQQQLVSLSESRLTDHAARATTDATRAMQHEARSKLSEAHRQLSEVYRWFTEGLDTKDLQEAKALLAELTEAEKRQ